MREYADEVAPSSDRASAISGLREAIDRLASQIEHLEGRLDSVLVNQPPTDTVKGVAGGRSVLDTLVIELHEKTDRLYAITQRVDL